ncbi:MAG: carbonic anhydrase [Clostridiales bacterium]|nr:carbonic anhydrase [Clostridiales bacterium]
MDAAGSLERLKEGNQRYLLAKNEIGDISEDIRRYTAEHGQHPFAIVIACSDSREIPEAIFSCGIGDLFVIRVAGNVVDSSVLGSVEYAAAHLGCQLVVVLGHTKCGAVAATIAGGAGGYTKAITDQIAQAIQSETNSGKASCLNAEHTAVAIRNAFRGNSEMASVQVTSALYDVRTGKVTFFSDKTAAVHP